MNQSSLYSLRCYEYKALYLPLAITTPARHYCLSNRPHAVAQNRRPSRRLLAFLLQNSGPSTLGPFTAVHSEKHKINSPLSIKRHRRPIIIMTAIGMGVAMVITFTFTSHHCRSHQNADRLELVHNLPNTHQPLPFKVSIRRSFRVNCQLKNKLPGAAVLLYTTKRLTL